MVDTLPTFDEDYGATGAGDNSMPGAEESGEGGNGDSGSETATTSGTSGASGNASSGTEQGHAQAAAWTRIGALKGQ
jgi:hypothetical protein